MVSQGMFRLMGYIYSIIAAIGSTIQAGSCLVKSGEAQVFGPFRRMGRFTEKADWSVL